jgi:hypothetical protein
LRGDGRQPDLAVLGGQEGSAGAVRVSSHVEVGARANPLDAYRRVAIILLRRRKRRCGGGAPGRD